MNDTRKFTMNGHAFNRDELRAAWWLFSRDGQVTTRKAAAILSTSLTRANSLRALLKAANMIHYRKHAERATTVPVPFGPCTLRPVTPDDLPIIASVAKHFDPETRQLKRIPLTEIEVVN